MAPPPTLIVAAPASGCGKTTVTLGLLRCLRNAGIRVASFKVGPDYIDPAFHAAAGGRPCFNIDPWAMRPETIAGTLRRAGEGADLLIGEGVMGLFDGASDGTGSTADLAALLGAPVVLVLDVRGQGASAAAVVNGFVSHRDDVAIAGVVMNRVGSAGHRRLLDRACADLGVPILGHLPRRSGLALPDRHLGLVQAGEHGDLEGFLETAAAAVGESLDIERLQSLARTPVTGTGAETAIPPLGQRVAVARDTAFAFAYPHVLEGWRAAGAEIGFFSPLADEAPGRHCDAIYLPGGYPELHAGRLAGNDIFLDGLRRAAAQGVAIYGECGGYMVLGRGLVDGDGHSHAMASLLPVETSFAERHLHLGYRKAVLVGDGPLGAAGTAFRGHEFHYAATTGRPDGEPLFRCGDAGGSDLGAYGCRTGSVMGSFLHLIDTA